LLEKRIGVEQQLAEARKAVEDAEQSLRDTEKLRQGVEQKLVGIRANLENARLQTQSLEVQAEGLLGQLDESDFDLQTVQSSLTEDDTEADFEENLRKVGNRIDRLGPINLAAIDEFKTESERKNYLDTQNDDLQEALEALEGAIKKIDKGPPGKKNSTIHLLSGGEKALTAIALVFSIFRLNPAPFCMLDEVDAPLDDANVGRYARMVEEMSDQVQFIYITHNKIAMEMAHQLMGVTMHEPGVSRMVTVDVEEAAELAAV